MGKHGKNKKLDDVKCELPEKQKALNDLLPEVDLDAPALPPAPEALMAELAKLLSFFDDVAQLPPMFVSTKDRVLLQDLFKSLSSDDIKDHKLFRKIVCDVVRILRALANTIRADVRLIRPITIFFADILCLVIKLLEALKKSDATTVPPAVLASIKDLSDVLVIFQNHEMTAQSASWDSFQIVLANIGSQLDGVALPAHNLLDNIILFLKGLQKIICGLGEVIEAAGNIIADIIDHEANKLERLFVPEGCPKRVNCGCDCDCDCE
jgi:hypothetical protein